MSVKVVPENGSTVKSVDMAEKRKRSAIGEK
jgi:hypothetical protein